MIVGYERTSTIDQEAGMEAQERDLSAAGCDKLFIEQVSSVGKRQQLDAALDYVRDGDTLIVTKLDRLARSVPDLLTMVTRLEGKNVALRVLAMSGGQPLDTSTAVGKLMLARHAHRNRLDIGYRTCQRLSGAGRTERLRSIGCVNRRKPRDPA
jgi:DNA invertase Pin-like site-specific DNA recombinase